MLTVALLALFTTLCVLLSADRAWDNVTKPERNDLVFDGRHRAYGAFVLRREYDRRFVWAFLGALGFLGAVVAVPKAMAALGMYAPTISTVRNLQWIDVVLKTEPIELPKAPEVAPEKPKPAAAGGGPVVPAVPDIPVVVTDTLPDPGPAPGPKPDPGTPGGGGAPAPGPAPGGAPVGSPIGTIEKPITLAEAEFAPEFIGGHSVMVDFVQAHIRFPEDDSPQQKSYVEFVVDADGNVVRVRTKDKSRSAFSEAAERVVRAMPKWKPAQLKNGEKVACVLVLPIEFKTR